MTTENKVAETDLADSSKMDDVKKQQKLPMTLQQLALMNVFIQKQLTEIDIDRNLFLHVLTAAFQMQKKYLESKQKKGGARVVQPQIWKNFLSLF